MGHFSWPRRQERPVRKSAKKRTAKKRAARKQAKAKPALQLTRALKVDLYEARQYLARGTLTATGLRMPVEVYFKDPDVSDIVKELDDEFTRHGSPAFATVRPATVSRWSITMRPTTRWRLPAVWDRRQNCSHATDGTPGSTARRSRHFQSPPAQRLGDGTEHARLFRRAGFGLGRRITWAFEGNRLIVLPHAGFGENAYYDRASKSLQFYYFNGPNGTVYTCLSSDIVNHEFGHAVLDGLQPYYYESVTGGSGGLSTSFSAISPRF